MLDCFCWEMYVPVKWMELILRPGRTLLQNFTACVLWLVCWLDISEVKKLCLKLRTQLDFCLSISNTSDILPICFKWQNCYVLVLTGFDFVVVCLFSGKWKDLIQQAYDDEYTKLRFCYASIKVFKYINVFALGNLIRATVFVCCTYLFCNFTWSASSI